MTFTIGKRDRTGQAKQTKAKQSIKRQIVHQPTYGTESHRIERAQKKKKKKKKNQIRSDRLKNHTIIHQLPAYPFIHSFQSQVSFHTESLNLTICSKTPLAESFQGL